MKKALITFCFAALLSGCQNSTYTHPYSAYTPEKVDTTIAVPATKKTTQKELLQMLRPHVDAYKGMGELRIIIGNSDAPNAVSVVAIQKALLELGIPNSNLFTTKNQNSKQPQLRVSGYRITPPEQKGWNYPSPSYETTNSPLLTGTSVNTNLSKMIANPENTVRGNTLAPADGEHHAVIVENYRNGKAKTQNTPGSLPGDGNGGSDGDTLSKLPK